MALGRIDATGQRPLAAIESTRAITPLGDTRQEASDRLVRLEVGRQFQAQILSRFNDGTFMVRIADTAARLALPDSAQVGDEVGLTLVGTDPRATFSLDSHTAGTSATAGTRQAQALYLSAATQGQAATALASDVSAPAELSATGRLIAALRSEASEQGIGPALLGQVPISAKPGPAAPQLASALHDTLSFSGLFYESHVQQWANGERPLADLLREPQGRASTAGPATAITPAAAAAPGAVAELNAARANLLDYFSTALPPATGGGIATLDAAATQMINLQLNTLEQQRVQWQGELSPGQKMQWEVSRDGGRHPREDATAAQQEQWQSTVRFAMPGLGDIAATVHLRGNRVQIQVSTTSDTASAALKRHSARLVSALDAAGSTLENLTIRREADDGQH